MERTYSLNDLALITGFTTRTLRTYISKGLLNGSKEDKIWQFTDEDIDRFMSDPFVREGLRIKRNSAVFDFLADTSKKQGRTCVILDLPVSAIEAQKISAFFCEQMCKANDASFASGNDHGVFRVILTGAQDQVASMMKAYYETF